MPTPAERKLISNAFVKQINFRCHNAKLFEIYEGELAKYVLEELQTQLSPQAFLSIKSRLAPINVLKRVVDKQSKIYIKPPARMVFEETGTEQDTQLLGKYQDCYDINFTMQLANELFNLHKCVVLEPYLKDNKPKLRTIPADRFVVASNDPVEPNKMTHFAKIIGEQNYSSGKKTILHCFSKAESWVQDETGEILPDQMLALGNPAGVNPFGVIPFVYINRSKHELIPIPDSDTLQMTKLIPILISDLNYAAMYQCFSIIYGIDVDDEELKMAPNAFWRLKSDPASDKKPEVGSIKPQVDIAEVADYVSNQLAMWLQSKGIRPGAIGKAGPENFSSGISKTIDEMDTSEDRESQTHFFQKGEEELWTMTSHSLHPVWSLTPNYVAQGEFSKNVEIQVLFPEQRSDYSMADTVDNEIKKLNAGLTTKKRALMELNPDMNEEEIDALEAEIEAEKTVTVMVPDTSNPGNQTDNQNAGASDQQSLNPQTSNQQDSVKPNNNTQGAYGDQASS